MKIEGHTDYVTSERISPDTNFIASSSFDKTIKIWDINSGLLLKTLLGHSGYVYNVNFSNDGK